MINNRKVFLPSAISLLMVGAVTVSGRAQATSDAVPQASWNVHVFATGLQGPRGLKFGPNGMLYVAEAGTGGGTSTKGVWRAGYTAGRPLYRGKDRANLSH